MMQQVEKEKVVEVLRQFKEVNPWKGTFGQRADKFIDCFLKLRTLYNISGLRFVLCLPTEFRDFNNSGASYYDNNIICLKGRFSVITFLHEFAHALGMNQQQSHDWSNGLFKEVWPEKVENLQEVEGGMLVKKVKI